MTLIVIVYMATQIVIVVCNYVFTFHIIRKVR